jgi:hypothetical protein
VIPLDSPFAKKVLNTPEPGPRLIIKPASSVLVENGHTDHATERHPSEIGQPWQARLGDIEGKALSREAQQKHELQCAINNWNAKYGTK